MDKNARRSLLERIDRLLGDAVMGGLALALIFVGLAPEVFVLPGALAAAFDVSEMVFVALFALEFIVALLVAPSRVAFLRNPWRLLDVLMLAAAGLSFLPAIADGVRGTLALRLLRLGRFSLFGVRAGTTLAARDARPAHREAASSGEPRVFALDESGQRFTEIDWSAARERIATQEPDWIFLLGLEDAGLGAVADSLGVPEAELKARLVDAVFPRIERLERYTTLFAWVPTLTRAAEPGGSPTIKRSPLLLISSGNNVVAIHGSKQPALIEALGRSLEDDDARFSPAGRATRAMFHAVLRRYRRVAEAFEKELFDIETQQAQLSDQAFLDRTFRLRAETSRSRGVLKHLEQVLRDLTESPGETLGLTRDQGAQIAILADDAKELYDAIDDAMASVVALVELRLNIASFQMNKVMRLLAILTTLTLIPAVTGGLLGMNLTGNPWSPTLAQVSYGVAMGMTTSLYVFAIKGWLR